MIPISLPLPTDLAETVARLAIHSPANIAWRALGRITDRQEAVTEADDGTLPASWPKASQPCSTAPRARCSQRARRAQRALLAHSPALLRIGNLQAVLDEHLHHFYSDRALPLSLMTVSSATRRPSRRTMGLRVAQYSALDPLDARPPIRFACRFALRYGGRRETEEDRAPARGPRAFNSPFWPFVLATTSVGQEGIDFHWWSHSVVHWNTPANPVDFEQREGRVDRYAGHAIRRNIAAKHREAILRSEDHDPWTAAFRLGTTAERFGEFAPWWVYPGPAKIERIVMPYPLSIDNERLASLKRDVQLYRLTFGQPRQEDMLELLKQRYESEAEANRRGLLLDLRPPRSEKASDHYEIEEKRL